MLPIQTERLVIEIPLHQPDDKDLREIVGWLNNPLVVRYSEQRHKVHNLRSQKAFLSALQPQDMYYLIKKDKHLIGSMTAYIDLPNAVANVGIMIGDHSQWGFGYGIEAWTAVCNDLMEDPCVRKIEAGCMACNISMMSICTRYGMVEEGRQEAHFLINDDHVDLVHWGKFA